MMAIHKVDSTDKFRKDMYKSKRKDFNEVWQGDYFIEVGNIARFAPSACNSQPWRVENTENEIKVYRHKGRYGIMPKEMVKYFNQIDMGIFLCFLELCLAHENIPFEREIFEERNHDAEENLTAIYQVSR